MVLLRESRKNVWSKQDQLRWQSRWRGRIEHRMRLKRPSSSAWTKWLNGEKPIDLSVAQAL